MATVNLGSIKFKWKGTYAGGTAYTIDDVVSYNGSSYICIQASTGNLPTNATYFEQMSSAGTNGTDGTDLGTVLTTQGDTVVRGASGLERLPIGSAGQALKVNSGANGFEFGDAGKIKAFSRFALTGLSTLSATSSEYYFWTVTYNRQTNGDLWIVSDIPASELPNGPYVGPHIKIVAGSTTVKGSRGLKWFRPNTDNTELGFNSYFTASELGSTTGNITISHGWNWGGGATSATLPITYINLGYSASGNQQLDNRVPNSCNT